MNKNPYANLEEVKSKKYFFGYKEQKKQLIEKINSGDSNISILGSKATGKTSFLNYAREHCLENNILCINKVSTKFYHQPYQFFMDIFDKLIDLYLDQIDELDENDEIKVMHMNNVQKYEDAKSSTNISMQYKFNTDYYKWTKDPNKSLNSSSVIRQFHSIYKNFSSINKLTVNKKIVILIDDFQNLVGLDEKERTIRDPDKFEANKTSLDNLLESLRNDFLPNTNMNFQYIVAMYPGLLNQDKFLYFSKLMERSFLTHIDVNKFNNQRETEELILGLLDSDTTNSNDWYTYFQNKEISNEQYDSWYNSLESKQKMDGKLDKEYMEYLVKNKSTKVENVIASQLSVLTRRVYYKSMMTPYHMKLILSKIFDQFPKLSPASIHMINFSDKKKWYSIWSEVNKQGRNQEIVRKFSEYTRLRKYIFDLLIFNKRLSINEIIDYVRFSIALQIQKKINEGDLTHSEIDYTDLNNIIDDGTELNDLTYEKIISAIEQFEKDELIKHDKDDHIKYKVLFDVLASGFLQSEIALNDSPDVLSGRESNITDAIITKISNYVVEDRKRFDIMHPLNNVNGLNVKEYKSNFSNIIKCKVSTLDELRIDPEAFEVYSTICLENAKKINLFFIEIIINKAKSKLFIHSKSSDVEGNYLKGIIDRIKSIEDFSIVLDFGIEVNIEYFDNLSKAEIEKQLLHFKDDFRYIDYKALWKIGLENKAINNVTKEIDTLTKAGDFSSRELMDLVNNGTYLSMCQNDKDSMRLWANRYNMFIESLNTNPLELAQRYNYYLLKIMNEGLNRLYFNELVKLVVPVFKNFLGGGMLCTLIWDSGNIIEEKTIKSKVFGISYSLLLSINNIIEGSDYKIKKEDLKVIKNQITSLMVFKDFKNNEFSISKTIKRIEGLTVSREE